jgi:hypothetical protein
MDALSPLASALGLGLLAGARLYATVFAIGLLLRLEWIRLPSAWHHGVVLADTRVLIAAGVACAIEFIADKIPWVDSAWDTVHTVIRPIGAALLTSSLLSGVDPVYHVLLFLLAGGVAFSGHSAKAATRLAVNHSPEPFSNIALSFAEDVLFAGGMYLFVKHPWIMAGIVIGFLAIFAWLAPPAFRALRAEAAALRALFRKWAGGVTEPRVAPREEATLATRLAGKPSPRRFGVIATRDVKGLRNSIGTLAIAGQDAVFLTRRWFRPVDRHFGPIVHLETRKGLLLDELVLVSAGGQRVRFDLLAGQLESARAEAGRYAAEPTFRRSHS